MKIVHICLNSFFTDGFSYQDNLLTKYHKKNGHDVTIIASKLCFNEGTIGIDMRDEYINEYGIKVIRLKSKYDEKYDRNSLKSKFNIFYGLIESIENEKPDILFIHGVAFLDIKKIVEYLKKNRSVIVYVDNHADYSNSATNFVSKYVLHRIIWKHYAKMINPYVKKFYGVLPARVDFLIDNYNLSPHKCELLVMGADDELVKMYYNNSWNIRQKHGINKNDFVIISGGKIDRAKNQIFLFLEAIKEIKNTNIKVLIFGSVEKGMKDKLLSYCNSNIIYVGWLNNNETYNYLAESDLAIYPGRHSVLWEQTAGMGVPMIVKRWEGTSHIDVGGNVVFIEEDSTEKIKKAIEFAMNKNNYVKMKKIAVESGMKKFSYDEIAKQSIKND